eukprot:XP_027313399.1 small VCP/p97-interacting protein isoform X1 [Anas platyrhynchos]
MPAPGRPARPRGGASPARARRRAEAAGGAAASFSSFSSSSSSSPAAASRAGGGPRHGALPALLGGRRQGRGGDARPGNKKKTASRSCREEADGVAGWIKKYDFWRDD